MKTKAAKQPKQAKPAVQLKDIKPKKDARGGFNGHNTGALRNVSNDNT